MIEREIRANLIREFKNNPGKYPEKPGFRYYIVVCESDGTPIKTRPKRVIMPNNPIHRIMAIEDGLEGQYLRLSGELKHSPPSS